MEWIALSTVFFSAMIKFMFSPLLGPLLGLTYFETFVSNALGALVAMLFSFFAADFVSKIKRKRKLKKIQKMREIHGENFQAKKIFTNKNKRIIRFKNKVGMIPFCMWAPLFLSIPIGTIITTKFYGKRRKALFYMIVGLLLNNTIIVSITYLIKYEATHLF